MIVAAGVLFQAPSGRVLLLRRSGEGDAPGMWAFPGGKLEDGEAPGEAAVRECAEEIGLYPDSPGQVLMRRIKDGVDFTTFLCPVAEEFVPELNDEHSDFQWADIADALSTGVGDPPEAKEEAKTDAADWKEEDHPRGEDGKFGSGGGKAKSGESPSESKESESEDSPGTYLNYLKEDYNDALKRMREAKAEGRDSAYREAKKEYVELIELIKKAKQAEGKRSNRASKHVSEEAKALAKDIVWTRGSANGLDSSLMAREVQTLPVNILKGLHEANVRAVVCRDNITDYYSDLKGVQPRGWPPGSTFEQVTGVYRTQDKIAVVATIRDPRNKFGRKIPHTGEAMNGSANVVQHELLHAYDFCCGKDGKAVSEEQKFREARYQDLEDLQKYSYLMQPPPAGIEETFAEVGAMYLTKTIPEGKMKHLQEYFKELFGD